jgi:T5SS/PEP-CTERM-associated repeat protein
VTLTVVADPLVSATLTGPDTVCVGESTSMQASGAGGASLCVYQWQVSTVGPGGPWANILGATSEDYTTGPLTSDRWYRARYGCTGSGCDPAFSNVLYVDIGRQFCDGHFEGGDWFDSGSWGGGSLPTLKTPVTIRSSGTINQPGALAQSITILSGATLTISGNGSLEVANCITVQAGATLALQGEAALVHTHCLAFMTGSNLSWDGGTIRIDGGMLTPLAGNFIVGDTPLLSRLELLNGASLVVSGHYFVGNHDGDQGEVLLDGNSSLNISATMTVGFHGFGTMTVAGGSSVSSGGSGTTIGLWPTSEGLLTITGAGSTWMNSGVIEVGGNDGIGAMHILDGASVSCTSAWIAHTPASSGLVVVDSQSNWSCSGNLFIGGWPSGAGGNGALLVSTGASVSVGPFFQVLPPGTVSVELLTAEPEQSSIITAGSADLAGTLVALLGDGYEPMTGHEFTLLSASPIVGQFTTVSLPPAICVEYTPANVTLFSPLIGDLNCNGIVNGLDLGILLINWSIPPGAPGCGGAVPCPSDLNGDGQVNGLDLGILLASWTIQ